MGQGNSNVPPQPPLSDEISIRPAAAEAARPYDTILREDAFYLIDLEGRLLDCNRAAEAVLGYRKEEVLGRCLLDLGLLSPAEREKGAALLERNRRGEATGPDMLVLRHRNGALITVELRSYPVELDGLKAILGIARDNSERKRAEDALRQSQERYRVVSELVSDFAYSIRVDEAGGFRLEWVTDAAAHITGLSTDELQRQGIRSLVHPADAAAYAGFGEKLRAGESATVDYRVVTQNGETRWLRDYARPVWDAAHTRVVQVIGAARDITGRKRAQDERQRLEARLQSLEKQESLAVLAGGIAHDFNNILTGILGHASLALMKLPPTSPARGHLEQIEKAANRAADVAAKMLAYSGKGRFVVAPLDLSEIVENLASCLRESLPTNASLHLHLNEAIPELEGDAHQIRQVVTHLVQNACEALEEEGTIRVGTGLIDADQEYLSGAYLGEELPEGLYAFLRVADTGCGMDEQAKARMFDPFFTTKFVGRGLGLAEVLGIVRGHRGAIRVDTEPGEGTTMTVLFPARHQPEVETRPEPPLGAGNTAPGELGTILVIDDESVVLSVAEIALTAAGFNVIVAADGARGLAAFREAPDRIAAVVLDLSMPGMSGEQVLAGIRAIRPDARVIVSSGYDEREVAARLAGQEPTAFLPKPFRIQRLVDKLQEVLGLPPSA